MLLRFLFPVPFIVATGIMLSACDREHAGQTVESYR